MRGRSTTTAFPLPLRATPAGMLARFQALLGFAQNLAAMLMRGLAWRMAICMSRIGTPLTSPAVQKVRRSPCGVMCLQPAVLAMRFTMRRGTGVASPMLAAIERPAPVRASGSSPELCPSRRPPCR